VRQHVEKLLVRAGFDVTTAADGLAALTILKSGADFDLLFTDVVMPGGLNGVQLAEAAAEFAPAMKVLYTSGFPASAFDEVGVRPRADFTLLKKPYRTHDLIEALTKILNS
jgi:CheY-like chemotaxis protein